MFKNTFSNRVLTLFLVVAPMQLVASTAPPSNSDIDQTLYHCVDPEIEEETEQLCDANNGDNQPAFTASPLLPDTIQIDIRPESCESFFDDYLHTRRGLRIETALELAPHYNQYQSTVSTFPIIDFISHGELRVVKTRDLTTKSFQLNSSEDALYKQIIEDAEDIQERFVDIIAQEENITAVVNGSVSSISRADVRQITLDIVIQSGIASLQHAEQIKRAKHELKMRWGFNLQVIEIP